MHGIEKTGRRRSRGPRTRPLGCLLVLVFVATAALSGCATFERAGFAWNLLRAMRAGERFRENHENAALDISFTPLSDVALDVYAPTAGDGHPVLIFVHGGGWDQYDKELFAPIAMRLVPQDVVVVIPDYTLYPDAGYRQMSREVAAAVAWTIEHVAEYGGDPSRITLSGHSAGGHLSGLVAFDDRWLADVGYRPSDLCGWIGMSGVYDIDAQMAFERSGGSDAPVMTAVMGGEENFPAASPISYVSTAAEIEITLVHGAEDEIVPLSITTSLADRLIDSGREVELLVYEEADHVDFLFESLSDDDSQFLLDVIEAVRSCSPTARNTP